MIFTLENVLNSLAAVLKKKYAQYPVYYSPNQQGTDYPCFFIFYMPSSIEGQLSERFIRDLGVDIVFVQQRNIVNGSAEILAIAEYLDEALELFPYLDQSAELKEDGTDDEGMEADTGNPPVLLRTVERQWKSEDEELHYQFHIRQRIAVSREVIPMKEMEENIYVKGE